MIPESKPKGKELQGMRVTELREWEIKIQEGMRKDVCQHLALKTSYFPLIDVVTGNGANHTRTCALTNKTCVGDSPSFGEYLKDIYTGLVFGKSEVLYDLSKKRIERCHSRKI